MRITRFTFQFIFFLILLSPFISNKADGQTKSIRIEELITAFSDSIKKYYVFPEKAIMISEFLQMKLKTNAYTHLSNDPQKLAKQIAHDVNLIHRDPHLRIMFDPAFDPQVAYNPTEEEKLQRKKYWREHNYSFQKAELLPGNIGYLAFNSFVDDIETALPTIKAALTFLKNTDALIIDLRENTGGNPLMVSQIESYFFNSKTEMNGLISRLTNDTIRLFADPAKTDSLYLPMPVYILTSKHTFSGAEDFCYGMQTTKRATIVGEVTGGGAHPQKPFAINQGFILYIPFARSLNPITKTDWELTGIIPDEKTPASQALIKTMELIFKYSIATSTDPKAKNRSQYYLNTLGNREKQLNENKLIAYTGMYGGLDIYIKKNKLYCRNNYNGGFIAELKHLSNHLFVLDKDAQIEFIIDARKQFSKLKIRVNDGSIFEETKNR